MGSPSGYLGGMKDLPHPIIVILGVMFAGIVVWPWLQRQQYAPRGSATDALVVGALVGGYYFYKKFYDSRKPKK